MRHRTATLLLPCTVISLALAPLLFPATAEGRDSLGIGLPAADGMFVFSFQRRGIEPDSRVDPLRLRSVGTINRRSYSVSRHTPAGPFTRSPAHPAGVSVPASAPAFEPGASAGQASQEGAAIEVLITDEFDSAVQAAHLTVESISGYTSTARSDESGAARIGNLLPGTYEMTLQAAGRTGVTEPVVLAAGRTTRLTRLLSTITPAGISATVTDEQRGALPGAVVAAHSTTGQVLEAVADAAGRVTFTPLRPGRWTLTATIPGFGSAELDVEVEAGRTVASELVMALDYAVSETVSVIVNEPRTYAANVVPEPMIRQQAPITSVTAVVDNLPGVSVQEGDTYGFDDWSSSVVLRGFQTNINESQLGTTIDGFPNGTSDYWSGSKANRFVDTANLRGVDVSQGTADIASRSHEALGGTFNYVTNDPAAERAYTASFASGEHDAERYYVRIDTGPIPGAPGADTRAWLSASRQSATDWVNGAANNEREHIAGKLTSTHGRLDIVSYLSYDQVREDVYQRLYSADDFSRADRWDRLTGDWPGIPYLNQFYRPGWYTYRKNTFGYVEADWSLDDASSLTAGAYLHRQNGVGGWLPPYIVDVADDGSGPESELMGNAPVRGGAELGLFRFVDRNLAAVGPEPGCTSSFIFNYYGAGGPEVDPACHPGATAVQSFRHSHYGKDRHGLTLDTEWTGAAGGAANTLRTGLWFEDSTRTLGRDWHRILDPLVGMTFDETPYWQQYDWRFPQQMFKWYVEDTIYAGPLAISGGIKQFLANVSRRDRFGDDPTLTIDSDSDLLFSAGATLRTPVEGFELFAGYAENFKSLSNRLLEVPGRSLGALEPETATNVDVGMRYSGDRVALGATWYVIDFDNRIFFLGPTTTTGPQYLIPGGGAYFNAGGIDTSGVELSATVQMPGRTSFYTAYTSNDSQYVGTGDAMVDASQNIQPGTDVPGVPARLWVLSLDRSGPLEIGISGKYTSSRRVSLTADWHADAYWLVDAYLTFSVDGLTDRFESVQVSLVANNLLDTSYLSSIVENAAWLGSPRTISMNMSLSF